MNACEWKKVKTRHNNNNTSRGAFYSGGKQGRRRPFFITSLRRGRVSKKYTQERASFQPPDAPVDTHSSSSCSKRMTRSVGIGIHNGWSFFYSFQEGGFCQMRLCTVWMCRPGAGSLVISALSIHSLFPARSFPSTNKSLPGQLDPPPESWVPVLVVLVATTTPPSQSNSLIQSSGVSHPSGCLIKPREPRADRRSYRNRSK